MDADILVENEVSRDQLSRLVARITDYYIANEL
jgi:hypothetical protein